MRHVMMPFRTAAASSLGVKSSNSVAQHQDAVAGEHDKRPSCVSAHDIL
jgi:hypothetical protein